MVAYAAAPAGLIPGSCLGSGGGTVKRCGTVSGSGVTQPQPDGQPMQRLPPVHLFLDAQLFEPHLACQHHAFQDGLGAGRTAGHVHIHGDVARDGALDGVAFAEHAAGDGADAGRRYVYDG